MVRSMLLFLTVFPLFPTGVLGQFHFQERALKGLPPIKLEVSVSAPSCLAGGPEESVERELRALLGLSLQREGVKVSESSPTGLYLDITCLASPLGLNSSMMGLELQERIQHRDQFLYAITWQYRSLVSVGKDEWRQGLRDDLQGLVTFFLRDYLTANPKGS